MKPLAGPQSAARMRMLHERACCPAVAVPHANLAAHDDFTGSAVAEDASYAEAEKIWTALIDEAVPVANAPGVFMFRGATYMVPASLELDGRVQVQVLRDNGQSALWSGELTGPLLDADKRLRAKLKQLVFLGTDSGHRPPPAPERSNGQAEGDDGVIVTKSIGARAVRTAPAPAPQTDDLEVKWGQLIKREGFDASFQNAILERVQTPTRAPLRPASSEVPPMPAPSHMWPREVSAMSPRDGGGVSANVEEVPVHLRGRAVNLIGANDVYCDPHVISSAYSSTVDALTYNSASSWTETGLSEKRIFERRESAYSTMSDAPSSRFVLISDFASSQGAQLRAGVGVSLVRHGQKGWVLVRDREGRKLWVPQTYLQPDKIVNGDGRVPMHAMPVRSAPPAAAIPAMCAVSEVSNESNDKISVIESMEQEMFEPWLTEGVEAPPRSQEKERLSSRPCDFNEQILREDAKQQQEKLYQRVSQLHGLVDMDLVVKLEQVIVKEREEREKERLLWCGERDQLKLAAQMHQVQSTSSGGEGETVWQNERRRILQELHSERERAAWLEDRLLASEGAAVQAPPAQDLLLENQRLQEALEKTKTEMAANNAHHRRQLQEQQEALNRLQAAFESVDRKNKAEADREKAALRQSIQTLQNNLADRDVALATISQGQLSQLVADQKGMDGLTKDLLDLGQALGRRSQGRNTGNGKTVAELEVENSALKQMYQLQVSQLEQAQKAVERQRELTVANAVLANKYTTLLQQSSILKQKLDGLQLGQPSPHVKN